MLGAQEIADLLGLSRQGLHKRRKRSDFPEPYAEVAATPLWTDDQIRAYARDRASRFEEREQIEELAQIEEPARDYFALEEAAETLGVDARQIWALARQWPTMPRKFNRRTGETIGIPRDALGVWGRALGSEFTETAA